MRHIAYYISGHGYGHAVRSIEIIKALLAQNPYLFFHIRTTAPAWFFSLNLKDSFLYERCEIDVGTVQHDFSEVDIAATCRRVTALYDRKSKIVADEVRYLQQNQVELIIGDLPPLAFAIAETACLPSIAIGNFSWDWIYAPYIHELHDFREVIAKIKRDYRKAEVLLRLPMHGKMSAFRKIIDIPLVARKAQRKRRDVRRVLRIEKGDRHLVLVALRPTDLRRIQFQNLAASEKFQIVVINQEQLIPGVMNLPKDLLPFQELVHAADVVVSKPGYGIVSECLVNKTPLVYTERKDFREYPVLAATLQKSKVGCFLELDSFFAGIWQAAIEKSMAKSWPPNTVSSNGDVVAAGHILKVLEKGAAPGGHSEQSFKPFQAV